MSFPGPLQLGPGLWVKTGSGKRQGRAPVGPGDSINSVSGSLSIVDDVSKRSFLIDSGADVSVFPATHLQRGFSTRSPPLRAANGSSIECFGSRTVPLSFGPLVAKHSFKIASVNQPILGSDFFHKHDLLIDVHGRRLLRLPSLHTSLVSIPAYPAVSRDVCGLRTSSTNPFERLLEAFPQVLVSRFDSSTDPLHGVYHTVPTTGPPLFARPRRLAGEKLEVAKQEFLKMQELGIIRPSSSPWASPLHVCLLYTSPSPRDS